jgi:hypothetical protein
LGLALVFLAFMLNCRVKLAFRTPFESLRQLAQSFEQTHRLCPDLSHSLIEADEATVWENINLTSIQRMFIGDSFGLFHKISNKLARQAGGGHGLSNAL